MTAVKVDINFQFYANDHIAKDKSQLKTSKYVECKDEIPCSTWEVSCEKKPDGIWQINVDLLPYTTFRTTNVIAAGKACLIQDFEDSKRLRSFTLSDVFHPLDISTTQLNNLASETVWYINATLIKNAKYIVDVNIILFCNEPPPKSLSKIQSDFADIFKNGLYTDVVLVAEEKEFKVHKVILGGRSEVFQRMLEVDMKEKKENKVVIEDVKSEVLEKLLMFMYSGTLGNIDDDVEPGFLEELFTAAEKYALADLKKAVARLMCSGITSQNIGRRFVLADQFEEKDLRMKCLEFFKDNWVGLSDQDKSILF